MPSFHSAGTLPVDHTLVMTLCKASLIGFSAPFQRIFNCCNKLMSRWSWCSRSNSSGYLRGTAYVGTSFFHPFWWWHRYVPSTAGMLGTVSQICWPGPSMLHSGLAAKSHCRERPVKRRCLSTTAWRECSRCRLQCAATNTQTNRHAYNVAVLLVYHTTIVHLYQQHALFYQ